MKDIIKSLKEIRKKKGLSQSELGTSVGLPQSHISHIESGNVDIRMSSLIEIGRCLDVELMLVPRDLVPSIQALLSGESSQQPAWRPDD